MSITSNVSHYAHVRREDKLNEKLREEAKENVNFTNKKFVIILPSTLGIKKSKEGFLLVSLDNKETLKIETLEENNATTTINLQREKALREKCYLLFSSDDEEISIYLADYYKELEESIDNYNKRKKRNANVKLYDYVTKGSLLGEIDEYLYLVYKKDGNILNYEEYLK